MGPSHEILNQICLSPPFGKKSLTGKVNCQLTFSHCPRRLCVQGRFCLEQPVTLHLNFPRDTLWGWRRRGVQPWRATPACVAGHESGALVSRCPSGVPAVAVPGASRRPRQKQPGASGGGCKVPRQGAPRAAPGPTSRLTRPRLRPACRRPAQDVLSRPPAGAAPAAPFPQTLTGGRCPASSVGTPWEPVSVLLVVPPPRAEPPAQSRVLRG